VRVEQREVPLCQSGIECPVPYRGLESLPKHAGAEDRRRVWGWERLDKCACNMSQAAQICLDTLTRYPLLGDRRTTN